MCETVSQYYTACADRQQYTLYVYVCVCVCVCVGGGIDVHIYVQSPKYNVAIVTIIMF